MYYADLTAFKRQKYWRCYYLWSHYFVYFSIKRGQSKMFVYAKDSASTRMSAQTNPHLGGMYKLSRIQLFMNQECLEQFS